MFLHGEEVDDEDETRSEEDLEEEVLGDGDVEAERVRYEEGAGDDGVG